MITINATLAAKGLILKNGTIVDYLETRAEFGQEHYRPARALNATALKTQPVALLH